jgi:O-antigen/teichoic acid export membrane protein
MSLRRNIAHLLVFQVLTWLVSFVFLIYGPRHLGSAAIGAATYAIAYVGFFALFAGLGTSTLLVRDIARDHSRLSQYVYNATLLKLVTVVVVPIVGIGFAVLIGNSGDRLTLIVLGFIGMAFATLSEVAVGALNGLEIISRPAFLGVVQVYIANGIGILALAMGYGVIVWGAIVTFSAFVPLVASFWMLRPHLQRPVHFDPKVWRHLFRDGIPLMTLVVFNVIYGTIDIPILGAITDDHTVGLYGVAYRWVGIPIFITTAVVTSYFPRFSAHGSPLTPEYPRLVNQSVRIVMLAAVPSSIGLAMVADDLVHLVYTPEFYGSISLIQILALHIPLAAMDTVLASALIAANRQRRYLYVALGAAILNPIACVLLIHWADNRFGNGAIGAAIVTVVTETYILVGALRLRVRGVFDRASTENVIRIIAAGLVMVPLLFLGGSLPLLVQVALGVASYPLALLLFRAVTVDEVRRLLASLPFRRRRPVPEPIE